MILNVHKKTLLDGIEFIFIFIKYKILFVNF